MNTMPLPVPDVLDLPSAWITQEGGAWVQDAPTRQAPTPEQLQADGPALRESLRAASLSARLSLQQARRSRDPAQLARALEAVDSLLGALDAADALATVTTDAARHPQPGQDRLEPWPWLQEAWTTLEPLAQAKQVRARLRLHGEADALGAIYGHAEWLNRLLRECLESALNNARARSVLDIEYRQMGPRALIALKHTAALSQPHDQARLALCRRIAQWHGGELRLELDDELRDWLIDLPTGAPVHAEATLDGLNQAQHFARDLEALRARARRRSLAAQTTHRPAPGDLP